MHLGKQLINPTDARLRLLVQLGVSQIVVDSRPNHECFPDEGSVDMAACIRAYRDVGYRCMLCPDHVPLSDLGPARERFFAFALGYTKGLIQATA
jgi:D-mannonate dehydratase